MYVIKSGPDHDILEQRHAKNRKDEHDQEEKEADINQSREGHDKGKK